MNLLTDEFKAKFSETDWPAVRRRIDCIEQMKLRWDLDVANGHIEDADDKVDEICRCMDEIKVLAEKKYRFEILSTAAHLKIMKLVVRKHE